MKTIDLANWATSITVSGIVDDFGNECSISGDSTWSYCYFTYCDNYA